MKDPVDFLEMLINVTLTLVITVDFLEMLINVTLTLVIIKKQDPMMLQ